MPGGSRDRTAPSLTQPRLRGTRRGFRGPVVFLDTVSLPSFIPCTLLCLAVPAVVSPVAATQGLRKAQIKRAIILGFDGMDPELTERFIAEGKLPNLAKLRDQGTFAKLQTTFPPISPVAWSTFMTGVNPGKHNIYDFLARDLSNYLPSCPRLRLRDRSAVGRLASTRSRWVARELKACAAERLSGTGWARPGYSVP